MASGTLAPDAVARLAGGPPRVLVPIGGGRNSQVFRLEAEDGRCFALKAYFRHPEDGRDRLAVEFGALGFLWSHGLRCIPEPLAQDPDAGLGLYAFIPGAPPAPPTEADVDAACAFLGEVHALRRTAEAGALPEASEARFSLEAVAENIDQRLARLATADPALATDSGLAGFLAEDLLPVWRDLRSECRSRAGSDFAAPLAAGCRTLSPSDFGFHNALRNGADLVFLDFEYFGWDDPAKLVADFLLHPGMDLSLSLRQRFASRVLDTLAVDGLARRVRLAFPLFGIKWCAILLNEFLPGPLDRRSFADPGRGSRERQALQLAKARTKLANLVDDHARFPYFAA